MIQRKLWRYIVSFVLACLFLVGCGIQLASPTALEYFDRGVAASEKGELDQAIDDFTKAIELDPKLAFAYNNRGNVYRKKGNYDQAISDYTKAIEIAPAETQIYINRAYAYYEDKGAFDLALTDFDKAIELNPNLASAYKGRGLETISKLILASIFRLKIAILYMNSWVLR